VTGYERGLYFSGVHDGFVKHSNFYGNTRYGANLVGPDSYGLLFDANTYFSAATRVSISAARSTTARQNRTDSPTPWPAPTSGRDFTS
jgi:hypothetical protein